MPRALLSMRWTGPTPEGIPAHLLSAKQDEPVKVGWRKAVFPIDEGDVTLIFPEGISPTGLQDLSEYLAIFLKKEARKKLDSNTSEILDQVKKFDL